MQLEFSIFENEPAKFEAAKFEADKYEPASEAPTEPKPAKHAPTRPELTKSDPVKFETNRREVADSRKSKAPEALTAMSNGSPDGAPNAAPEKLTYLKNNELHARLQILVSRERKITNAILQHLAEVARRGLYLEMAYSSMYDYAVKGLGYSESAALRRLRAARLVNEMPELGKKIESGALSLSQIEKAQRAFVEYQKMNFSTHQKLPLVTKCQVLDALEGKSARETDVILAKELHLAPVKFEKIKKQADESVRLEIVLTPEQFELLEQARRDLGFVVPSGSWAEVISYLGKFWGEKAKGRNSKAAELKEGAAAGKVVCVADQAADQAAKTSGNSDEPGKAGEAGAVGKARTAADAEAKASAKSSGSTPSTAASVVNRTSGELSQAPFLRPLNPKRKAIPRKIRFQIHHRDRECQYTDPRTGKKCGSSHFLNIDHIQPVWAGGGNEESNLRILCAAHNRFRQRVGK